MSETPLADQAARQAIREELDTTLVVEAAAGTGKTTELVARIIATLRRGKTRLSRIAAVTFTEKAAGEMKLRLRTEIERARQTAQPREKEALELALSELEVARVGTIHSLCSDLLHERPVEARVDPLFEVAASDEAQQLFEATFDAWFQRILSAPPEGVRRFLRRKARGRSGGVRNQLRDAAWRLVDHRDFTGAWRRDPVDRVPAIDRVMTELVELGALAARSQRTSYLKKNLEEVQRFVDDVHHRESVRARDPDGLGGGAPRSPAAQELDLEGERRPVCAGPPARGGDGPPRRRSPAPQGGGRGLRRGSGGLPARRASPSDRRMRS